MAAAGVEIAVVVFIHSYRNPAHERLARDLAERHGVGLRMELSAISGRRPASTSVPS